MRFRLFIACILLCPVTAFAQTTAANPAQDTNSFSIAVSPQYPAPHSTVSLSLSSSSFDMSNASMVVSVNGKSFYTGPTENLSVPVGGAGNVSTIRIRVTAGGASYEQTAVVQPQDVVLIAEPVSSAPTLYPGKPLVPLDGNTRVVAVANIRDASGKVLNPASLSYSWVVDNNNILNSSGIGRDSLLVASPMEYRTRTVSVTVQSSSGSLVGSDSLTLAPMEPTVHIYQDDPLLGIRFDHALQGLFTMNGSESSFYGAVFSSPLAGSTVNTSSGWRINGSDAQTGNTITLRSSGSGQGSASLMFRTSVGYDAQTEATLPISFGSTQTSNLLGL